MSDVKQLAIDMGLDPGYAAAFTADQCVAWMAAKSEERA